MTKSIYNLCLFYKSSPLEIVKMQINDTLILVDNAFASNEEKTIKVAKLIIKDRKYLISAQPVKFNRA